ncbi:hypothetical protein ACG0UD_27585, partial [Klebsiella pneumoniae]
GIDGIGFQFSDILSSKNGSIKPAIAESTIVPINDSNDDYKFIFTLDVLVLVLNLTQPAIAYYMIFYYMIKYMMR